MSALSYFLEDENIPTVTISLIRLHSEKVGNPRSLWVPFELGRPLGPPGNAAFQIRVITAALRLLEASPGPVVLEDFPDEDPTSAELPGWHPPFDLATADIDLGDPAALERALLTELRTIAPSYERFVTAQGRTTVGISGFGIDDCVRRLAAATANLPPGTPSPVQALRWAIDDVKAYYLEAMSAGPNIPASRQMQGWFWDQTLAARTIIALRKILLASEDPRSQAIGRMSLVPGVQVLRLKLT